MTGGFDLAAEWMGWENKFHCEWNEFGQKVLNYYWPDAECFSDITKTDFKKYNGTIDIISGGFPCQPYSQAGKRKGNTDERHLWPEMLRAIREIQPSWVVGENVLGLLNWSKGMVFHEVQTNLEAEGFIIFPYVLPACSVNAPHRRDRVWIVAYSDSNRNRNIERQNRKKDSIQGIGGEAIHTRESVGTATGDVADTNYKGLEGGGIPFRNDKEGWQEQGGRIKQPAINDGRTLPTKTWENFPTQPPIRGRDDGVSGGLAGITFSKHRNESIKGYGNAVVPQLVFQIFKSIEAYAKTIE